MAPTVQDHLIALYRATKTSYAIHVGYARFLLYNYDFSDIEFYSLDLSLIYIHIHSDWGDIRDETRRFRLAFYHGISCSSKFLTSRNDVKGSGKFIAK